MAKWNETDFYPDVYDKAAVLACRISWNHPMPGREQASGVGVQVMLMISTAAPGIRTRPIQMSPSMQR